MMRQRIYHQTLCRKSTIADEYVPLVHKVVEEMNNVYIPSGNKELFEATAIWAGMLCSCKNDSRIDTSKYYVKTTDGGNYIVGVEMPQESIDKDYVSKYTDFDSWSCGSMTRDSEKYSAINSWSVDTRFCSRQGAWQNNRCCDYEYFLKCQTI